MSIKVYGASKLRHAPMWNDLREAWPEILWTARWPYQHVGQVPDTPDFASLFWLHDHEDVEKADGVLVYAEPDDVLRGALVEAGMAIALGKWVLCVGDNPGFGTWQWHPQVSRLPDLDAARALFELWSMQDARRRQP
jgi:nucleoside 2-deoxyribosyltransferase